MKSWKLLAVCCLTFAVCAPLTTGCGTTPEQIAYTTARVTNESAHQAVADFNSWLGVQRQLIQKDLDTGNTAAAQARERKWAEAEREVRAAVDTWNSAVDDWQLASAAYHDAKDAFNGSGASDPDLDLRAAKLEAAQKIADIAMQTVFRIATKYLPADQPLF